MKKKLALATVSLAVIAVVAFGVFSEDTYVAGTSSKSWADEKDSSVTDQKPAPYRASYVGNLFSTFARDAIFTLVAPPGGGTRVLNVYQSFLNVGDVLQFTDTKLYDFEVGTKFLAVRRESDGLEGFLTLETATGEMMPVESNKLILSDGSFILPNVAVAGAMGAEAVITAMSGDLVSRFPSQSGKAVHPTMIAKEIGPALFLALAPHCPEELRGRIIEAAERMFDLYAFPEAKRMGRGVAWLYDTDWDLHWGVVLKAPWASGFANSVMAMNSAAMYRLTGEDKYRTLAYEALEWAFTSLDDGGASYFIDGQEFIAEYPYPSGVPQVRVLDGEIVSAVSIFNVAVLLRDPKLLMKSRRLSEGLEVEIKKMITDGGHVMNARYPWVVDSETYLYDIKLWSGQVGDILKETSLAREAQDWKLAPAAWW